MCAKSYKTGPRKLIRDYIERTKGRHITADDVLFSLKEEGYNVAKATIYRYFECLSEEGVLRKYAPIDGMSACYEYVDADDREKNHYHMKCDMCGVLLHLECRQLDKISEHIMAQHDFVVNKLKTVFYGTCADCRKKTIGAN